MIEFSEWFMLVQDRSNIQTTQPSKAIKSSSHLKVTNMLPVFAKTARFKWIFDFQKSANDKLNDANNNCGDVVWGVKFQVRDDFFFTQDL
jgi:hypothetical protein